MATPIPPAVATLAAALDAHEWRLARLYADDECRPTVHAALRATTAAREELLRETAIVNSMTDAMANLAWLATRYGRQGRHRPLNADVLYNRRVAAYLRWCVRRLREWSGT